MSQVQVVIYKHIQMEFYSPKMQEIPANKHVYTVGLCIGQFFSIQYDTIRLNAIFDILDEQFIERFSV